MNPAWEPDFEDWAERKASMSSCELSTSCMARGEYGVMVQIGADEENFPIDAAIFWTDEMHLYLRYDWGTWYKVSTDDPDNCSNICKRNSAKLLLCTTTSIRHHAVRVYHIDRLPEELFGKQTDDAQVSTRAHVEQTTPPDVEIQAAVDAEIEQSAGHVWSRFRPGSKRLYGFDFVQIGTRFYTIVHADFNGEWLADEEASAGEIPLWFSESAHRMSPAFQAATCRSFFAQKLPGIAVDSIVVLPEGCSVINGEEMQKSWREAGGTVVVKTGRTDDTPLRTLHEHLAAQPDEDIKPPELDFVKVAEISRNFPMNPESWTKKD